MNVCWNSHNKGINDWLEKEIQNLEPDVQQEKGV